MHFVGLFCIIKTFLTQVNMIYTKASYWSCGC